MLRRLDSAHVRGGLVCFRPSIRVRPTALGVMAAVPLAACAPAMTPAPTPVAGGAVPTALPVVEAPVAGAARPTTPERPLACGGAIPIPTHRPEGEFHALIVPELRAWPPAMPNACGPPPPRFEHRSLAVPGAEWALDVRHATLRGTVLDAATGEPLRGAQVTVPGASLGTVTDARGEFALRMVRLGTRRVHVWYPLYAPAEVEPRVSANGAFEPIRVELTPQMPWLQRLPPVPVRP